MALTIPPGLPALPDDGLPRPNAEYTQFTLGHLLRHGLRVLLACVVVGLSLGYLRGERYWLSTVYSVCIGLCSWLVIDLGRFALRPHPDSGWPEGWRGPALSVIGCCIGFGVGEALGDLVNGFPVYSGYTLGLRKLGNDLAVSGMIGALMSGWFYMRGKDAYHAAQAQRAHRDLNLAKLAMLQTQLEPHMLFNTLANLRVLIGIDPPRAQAMLDRLNAYLRATLGASRASWHPLAAEFERLDDYLALMAVRMGPRLAVRFELPEALRGAQVPPLLLQPLVENAIRHGLEPKVEGGEIVVSARAEGELLQLTVRDTGVGLPDASSAAAAATAARPAGTGGYGTQHVAERLATLFGERGGLALSPATDADGGTLAEVRLPLMAQPPAPSPFTR